VYRRSGQTELRDYGKIRGGFAPDALEPPTIDEAFEKLSRLAAAARVLRERYGLRRFSIQLHTTISGTLC